jgi:hypothetical protein
MSYLSRQVGWTSEYKYLYHATSRYVHFSTAELFRRVWGKEGDVKIGSGSFSEYWSDFALYWGLWLFIHTLAECADVIGDEPVMPPEKQAEFRMLLTSMSKVPIITPGELKTWSNADRT